MAPVEPLMLLGNVGKTLQLDDRRIILFTHIRIRNGIDRALGGHT
jgi:hypothetical protein